MFNFGDFVEAECKTVYRIISEPSDLYKFHLRDKKGNVKWLGFGLTALPDYVDFDGPPKPVEELDLLIKLRAKLVEGLEHAKACEDAMKCGTFGVVASFDGAMREVLLTTAQRESVKILVAQMFAPHAVLLSNEVFPLQVKKP